MNSTTKIIAGVAVLALIFAAVGYAATDYNAKTYNSGNNVTPEYITVTPSSFAALSGEGKVTFDSISYDDSGVATIYQFNGTVVDADTTVFAQNGKAVKLNTDSLTLTLNSAVSKFDAYEVKITGSGTVNANENYVIYFKLVGSGTDATTECVVVNSNTIDVTIDSFVTDGTITIDAYVACVYDKTIEGTGIGELDGQSGSSIVPPSEKMLENVSLLFTIAGVDA